MSQPPQQPSYSGARPVPKGLSTADAERLLNLDPPSAAAPPAYSPPSRDRLLVGLAAAIFGNRGQVSNTRSSAAAATAGSRSGGSGGNGNGNGGSSDPAGDEARAAYLAFQAENNDEEEDDEGLGGYSDSGPSTITVRISTAISVSSDDNLVVIPGASPADNAAAIATAFVDAIRQASSARIGIPMIDENGAPRPLRIEVDAGVDVNGTGNVLGPEGVIRECIARGGQRREQQQQQRQAPRKRGREPGVGNGSGSCESEGGGSGGGDAATTSGPSNPTGGCRGGGSGGSGYTEDEDDDQDHDGARGAKRLRTARSAGPQVDISFS